MEIACYKKKCKFFIWITPLDNGPNEELNTLENLQKKMSNVCLNPNCCILYKANIGNRDHVFIHCNQAKELWGRFQAQTRQVIAGNNVKSFCLSLCQLNQISRKNVIFFNLGVVILWSLWLERNNRIFNNSNKSMLNLWEDSCYLRGFWCIASIQIL